VTPIGVLKHARRAAMRRRYAYAALRILRRGLRAALALHALRQLAPERYSVSVLEIRREHFTSMRRLRARWPHFDPTDPRAEP